MTIGEAVGQAGAGPEPVSTQPVELQSEERNGRERTVRKVVTKQVKTLKELARVCGIDLRVWEIYRWKCGAWSTGMKPWHTGKSKHWRVTGKKPVYSQQYVVQAWMRPRVAMVAATTELEALKRKAAACGPRYVLPLLLKPGGFRGQGVVSEYAISDHHFGALIWGKETGGADYDIKLARAAYEAATLELINRMRGFDAERALLVLGNDQQNIDNRLGTTTAGTPQQTDVRYQKVFGVSRDCSIWAIERLLESHSRVEVILVPGNHDTLATWHLGDSLQAWFRQCSRVKIDNQPRFRKYFEHGVNMLMFTHGNVGKLELYGTTMAAEQSPMWGRTEWREAHTGDKHHRQVTELRGCTVRILPSLRPPDAWTSEHNFVGAVRAAEAYAWHDKLGLLGTATYSILPGR